MGRKEPGKGRAEVKILGNRVLEDERIYMRGHSGKQGSIFVNEGKKNKCDDDA